jgi:8-oxo-dGTP pyrophosphatase MutT (NUDIX family)
MVDYAPKRFRPWCQVVRRATYRYRAVRQIPGATALSSVFVCVLQPASDGRLLVGQRSASTSSPGLIQLPGGNLEPSPPGEELTLDTLRRHASTELAEETGVVADPDDLTP